MASKLLLLFLALMLAACSPTLQSKPAPSSTPRVMDATCSDLFEQAMSSPTIVPGGYECMSPKMQIAFKEFLGVTDDQDFAVWIDTYPSSTTVPCSPITIYDEKHNVKLYLETSSVGYTEQVRVFTNETTGKVDFLATAGKSEMNTVTLKSSPTCDTQVNWPKIPNKDWLD